MNLDLAVLDVHLVGYDSFCFGTNNGPPISLRNARYTSARRETVTLGEWVMPLVRIDLRQGKTPEYRLKIGDMVYRAMRETINVPEHDRFQVITDHPRGRAGL